MDHVAPGLEQDVTGLDHPRRLPLQLEEDLALGHVAEDWPGVSVRRRAGVTGWQSDRYGPGLGPSRDLERRLRQRRDHLNAWRQLCVLSAHVFLRTGLLRTDTVHVRDQMASPSVTALGAATR